MHPTEGMWQAFLDRESDPVEREELELHLSNCPKCCAGTVELGRQRARVTQLLNTLDVSAPTRNLADVLTPKRQRQAVRSLLWAAGIALCVVTAASATVHWGIWHRTRNWLLGAAPAPLLAPAESPVRNTAQSPSGISLQPKRRVDVIFEEWPASGEIEIAVRRDTGFSIVATQPVGYAVQPEQVEVANRGVAASYRIVFPEALPKASVRIAGSLVYLKDAATSSGLARNTGPGTYVLTFPSPPRSGPASPRR